MGSYAFRPEKYRGHLSKVMNLIFHDMTSNFIEVYADDVVVKSVREKDILNNAI